MLSIVFAASIVGVSSVVGMWLEALMRSFSSECASWGALWGLGLATVLRKNMGWQTLRIRSRFGS